MIVVVVVVDDCCCCCCFILEHLHCAWTFLCVPISVLLVAHSQLLELVDNFRIAFCERLQRWVLRSNTCVGEFSSLTFNMSGQKATNSSIQVLMLVINLCEKYWCWKIKESQRRLFCKNYTEGELSVKFKVTMHTQDCLHLQFLLASISNQSLPSSALGST